MLSEIIKCLPFQERKIAKLVSKEWFQICNRISFLKREKVVCYGLYSSSQILDILMNSDRPYFNLEFHNMNFTDSFLPFWEKCGKKIYSLEFYDCVLDEENVTSMVFHCEELLHLSWIYGKQPVEAKLKQPLCLNSAIQYLMKNNIIQNKLVSLKIQKVNCEEMCNYKLYGLFSIYPNIRRLEFSGYGLKHTFKSTDMRNEDLFSTEKFTFGCFLYKLTSSADIMEKICFDFGESALLNIPSFSYAIIINIPGLNRYVHHCSTFV